ncbi:hypothetical protein P175DRAFT_0499256 [Aspergillus ochraceoroseus IBT 24754]|uniref:ABM domain-containing protein n=1 Tax=Aspergillus ochraceoroseus IBT 24754 TaxID=1392256 RepID=A0A2T5M2G7_9EURO|nr:uncharacterized protein P175DRAFT_0499256 [Aspergillus ochraceoroseus IBT 24754]PTU22711.1 hypothetical protein P175DRAFT_0499256 [Aspergillus ochraceoroseus IBT 24754]
MPGEIYNVVKLVPKPGKFNEVVEAFKVLSKFIEEHEPKTQIYFALQPQGSEELVLVEKYTDADNLKAHASTAAFKQFGRAIGPLLAQKPDIRRASFLAGVEGRSKL